MIISSKFSPVGQSSYQVDFYVSNVTKRQKIVDEKSEECDRYSLGV